MLNIDKLTYAANLASLDPIAGNPGYISQGRHLRPCRNGRASPPSSRMPSSISPRRATSIARYGSSDAFIGTNIIGTYALLEAARAIGQALPERQARRLPFPACLDRRGLRLAREGRSLSGGHAIRSEFALFGEQSGIRPSGRCLAPNLRVADTDLQLLQQLRPLSNPRKAHSAGHSQRLTTASRCRSMATDKTCAIGSMWMTMRRALRSDPHTRTDRARNTTSAGATSRRTSPWSSAYAP